MRVELNEKLKEQLQAIAQLMKTEKRVPQTAYFPFIVCFEWVNAWAMRLNVRCRSAELNCAKHTTAICKKMVAVALNRCRSV